jgi:hypothetical protein
MSRSPKAVVAWALCAALFAAGTGLPLLTQAAGPVTIQKLAPFKPDLSVPAEVKLNCDLVTRIPAYIAENAHGKFDNVVLSDTFSTNAPGLSLAITIVGLNGKEGGLQTGAKHIVIEGTLWENGREQGSFRAKRRVGVTWGGSYKGTCNLLDRCAKLLGKDVAEWLQKPSVNARLGDDT